MFQYPARSCHGRYYQQLIINVTDKIKCTSYSDYSLSSVQTFNGRVTAIFQNSSGCISTLTPTVLSLPRSLVESLTSPKCQMKKYFLAKALLKHLQLANTPLQLVKPIYSDMYMRMSFSIIAIFIFISGYSLRNYTVNGSSLTDTSEILAPDNFTGSFCIGNCTNDYDYFEDNSTYYLNSTNLLLENLTDLSASTRYADIDLSNTKPSELDSTTSTFISSSLPSTTPKAKTIDYGLVPLDERGCIKQVCRWRFFLASTSNKASKEALVMASSSLEECSIVTNKYQNDLKEKIKLRKLCWETMFGQELVKLTIMDLLFTVMSIFWGDFFISAFLRLFNPCWFCWDLEKTFPKYPDFKVKLRSWPFLLYLNSYVSSRSRKTFFTW